MELIMSQETSSIRVLVTGATGFIALQCILQLLQQGYRVRGTCGHARRAPGQVKQTAALCIACVMEGRQCKLT
jgi:nucleoside-diphosphate-sugar epimerase